MTWPVLTGTDRWRVGDSGRRVSDKRPESTRPVGRFREKVGIRGVRPADHFSIIFRKATGRSRWEGVRYALVSASVRVLVLV
ncbi:hypothetical protein NSK11_contig00206-0001, partial [Nocardia seriolae]